MVTGYLEMVPGYPRVAHGYLIGVPGSLGLITEYLIGGPEYLIRALVT